MAEAEYNNLVTGIVQESVIMDATLLSALMSCCRYYDLRHNYDLVSVKGKSNSFEVGALIHKVLEVYYKHLINGYSKAQAIGQGLTAGQLYVSGCPYCADGTNKKPQCGHQPMEYPGLRNTPQHSEGYHTGWEWALSTCEQYFDFYKGDSIVPLAAEHVKGETLYEDAELRVGYKAKFDLIYDDPQVGIMSMDHKTHKQKRDKTSLNNQFMGQCALLKSRRIIINKIGLQTSLKPAEKFTREVVCYTADRLMEWQGEILPYYAYRYLEYLESGYWPPNFTHCDTIYGPCAFKSICESDRNVRADTIRSEYIVSPVKWDIMNTDD